MGGVRPWLQWHSENNFFSASLIRFYNCFLGIIQFLMKWVLVSFNIFFLLNNNLIYFYYLSFSSNICYNSINYLASVNEPKIGNADTFNALHSVYFALVRNIEIHCFYVCILTSKCWNFCLLFFQEQRI